MNQTFTYTQPEIVYSPDGKWYIYYTIKFDEKPLDPKVKQVQYRKEYGRKYSISLNTILDQNLKNSNAEKLRKFVLKDLKNMVDPKLTDETRYSIKIREIEATKKISYDEAIQIIKDENGWNNPVDTAVLSSSNIIGFLNESFREHIKKIKKTDNVIDITQDDITEYIENKYRGEDGKQWSLSTCINKLAWISYMFSALKSKKIIDINPTLGTGLRKMLKKISQPINTPITKKVNRFEVWTPDELKEFNEVANCDEHRFFYALGYTCYLGFIRRSEVLRLRIEHLNFTKKRFEIPSNLTKGGRKYDKPVLLFVPMNERLIKVLKEYIDFRFGDDNSDKYLFPHPDSNGDAAFRYTDFTRQYKPLADKLLFKKMPYALKHTGVSEMFYTLSERGIAPTKIMTSIQKMCRHATFSETMRYLSDDLGIVFADTDDMSW